MSGLRRFYCCSYNLKECYMPSQRAILADITELKLNPAKEHRHTNASGRLGKFPMVVTQDEIAITLPVDVIVPVQEAVVEEQVILVKEAVVDVVEQAPIAENFDELDLVLSDVVAPVQEELSDLRTGLVQLSEPEEVKVDVQAEDSQDSSKKSQKKKGKKVS
jgi:hypothetical protein